MTWISVKEREPPENTVVRVFAPGWTTDGEGNDADEMLHATWYPVLHLEDDGYEMIWVDREGRTIGVPVTHWQPLPDPPCSCNSTLLCSRHSRELLEANPAELDWVLRELERGKEPFPEPPVPEKSSSDLMWGLAYDLLDDAEMLTQEEVKRMFEEPNHQYAEC